MSKPKGRPVAEEPPDLKQAYASAVERYVRTSDEAELKTADAIGRQAVAHGVDIVEIAAIHHRAMMQMLIRFLTVQQQSDIASAGLLCASCPAWYEARGNHSRDAEGLERLFVSSLACLADTHRQLRSANRALRRISEVREEEARRMARDLHDDAGQLLASIHIALQELVPEVKPAQRKAIEKVRSLLNQTERQLRQLSHRLHPAVLDTLGLTVALESLAENTSQRSGMRVDVESGIRDRMPLLIETAVYRIAQEALTNAARHSGAKRVQLNLTSSGGSVVCAIVDDGIGFTVGQSAHRVSSGLGLIGIQERVDALGGELDIRSSPGSGTELIIRLPLDVSDP